jgi:hypothetical protein
MASTSADRGDPNRSDPVSTQIQTQLLSPTDLRTLLRSLPAPFAPRTVPPKPVQPPVTGTRDVPPSTCLHLPTEPWQKGSATSSLPVPSAFRPPKKPTSSRSSCPVPCSSSPPYLPWRGTTSAWTQKRTPVYPSLKGGRGSRRKILRETRPGSLKSPNGSDEVETDQESLSHPYRYRKTGSQRSEGASPLRIPLQASGSVGRRCHSTRGWGSDVETTRSSTFPSHWLGSSSPSAGKPLQRTQLRKA